MADPFDTPGYRFALNRFPGDGATTQWDLSFAGVSPGYISQDHVRAVLVNDTTGVETPVLLGPGNFILPTRLQITPPVPVGVTLEVRRNSPKDEPLLDYTDGALMIEKNLDTSNQQTVYAVAEMVDRFADALDETAEFSQAVLDRLAEVETTANAAEATANDAAATAALAVSTANSAVDTAAEALAGVTGAQEAAILATEAANAATAAAALATEAAEDAEQAALDSLATSAAALTTAETAESVANAIDAKAQTALDGVSDLATQGDPAKGAALVGYLNRTVHDKLDDWVSAIDMGLVADGDGSGGGTSNHTALSAAMVSLEGSGKTLHFPKVGTGVYNFSWSSTLRGGVNIRVDPGVILDFSVMGSPTALVAQGTLGPEIAISTPVPAGTSTVSTASAHGLVPGDWIILKGQRNALSTDAGDYRLGNSTGDGAPAFFTEPHQVLSVASSTSFTTASPVLFPGYLPDNSQETSPQARSATTVRKANFMEGVRIEGGLWKFDGKNLLLLRNVRGVFVDIDTRAGANPGNAVIEYTSLRNDLRVRSRHPSGIDPDHPNRPDFAAVRVRGSWYSTYRVTEINGHTGIDFTHSSEGDITLHPHAVEPVGINVLRELVTTHPGVYGGLIERPRVYGAVTRGLFLRGPSITVIEPDFNQCNRGVEFQGWGNHGSKLVGGTFRLCTSAVYSSRFAITEYSPAWRGLSVEGCSFDRCSQGVYIAHDVECPPTNEPSGVTIRGVRAHQAVAGVVRFENYVNNVHVDGVVSDSPVNSAVTAAVYAPANSIGHTLRNLTGRNLGVDGRLYFLGSIADADTFPSPLFLGGDHRVDMTSVRIHGSGRLGTLSSLNALPGGSYTIQSKDLGRTLTSGSGATVTVTVNSDSFNAPVGGWFEILQVGAGVVSIVGGSGVTIQGRLGTQTAGVSSMIRVTCRNSTTWVVSGDAA